ncbi:MAG: Eco57I restriction-modification methylase domain-containing protein [Bacteroidales bacterium]|nr:Eco57I restriction-modification methylase domain-containing protein [Bacteroidales bacterium]MDD4739544.1 Eco57I restriction-modification methylase domain-containing protein [Bacteroidales bacterium]
MKEINYNPDVLTCLANLSNDEVFTPPTIVNQMLDTLPKELWNNSKAKFLDPFSKSGVFLREIVKRLNVGLEKEIPNLQDRINHILKNQVYGIAITELTALLTRRSLYCSKYANGKKSITNIFKNEDGNIAYERIEHTFENRKCKYCVASEDIYDREKELESHAYLFIHNKNPYKNMQFDVIIGNPPYQLSDGGGRDSGAISLYHKFIQNAIKLNPKYLTMIIPARWYSGGKGLDDFRDEMLKDKRICQINDFPETSDCFPGLNIRGGICYFLWDREYSGDCKIINYKNGQIQSTSFRPLMESNSHVFIRYNEAISILRKVQLFKEKSFEEIVSARKPFGLDSNFSSYKKNQTNENNITLYRFGETGYINDKQVIKNLNWVKEIKVLVSKASPGGDNYPHQIISKPIIAKPLSCCTETYLVIGIHKKIKIANNVVTYMQSRFFRFMMSLIKNTQNISRNVFFFVPMQDFNEEWNDEKLYKKYGLSQEEIDFIESMIRPME